MSNPQAFIVLLICLTYQNMLIDWRIVFHIKHESSPSPSNLAVWKMDRRHGGSDLELLSSLTENGCMNVGGTVGVCRSDAVRDIDSITKGEGRIREGASSAVGKMRFLSLFYFFPF